MVLCCYKSRLMEADAYWHASPLVVATDPPDHWSLVMEGMICQHPQYPRPHLSNPHPRLQTDSQTGSHSVPHMLENTCCHSPGDRQKQFNTPPQVYMTNTTQDASNMKTQDKSVNRLFRPYWEEKWQMANDMLRSMAGKTRKTNRRPARQTGRREKEQKEMEPQYKSEA